MLNNLLFRRIDNSQITIFRILFGLIAMIDCWGAIATGWVKETFVEPKFTFCFIGFEWTWFLLGENMYYVYIFLGFLGLLITVGAFYKVSSFLFALGWSLVYFMQKEHYNNHYYLLMLVAWAMVFIPANRYKAVDVLLWPKLRSEFTYQWTRLLFIVQLFLVYTFAALAKLYPGWMEGDFLMIRYKNTAHWIEKNIEWDVLTEFVYSREFAKIMAYLGFGFDLLIVPLLFWKRTRIFAFLMALFFHIFNSITLHIGIFPYFALAMCLFFFSPEQIRNVFFPKKTTYLPSSFGEHTNKKGKTIFSFVFVFYFIWQSYLPVRHWLIPGDVLWTEEGHRLSWRMMLRSKSATTHFFILDKETGNRSLVNLNEFMTPLQISRVATHPDMIWQFSHYLKKEYAKKGKEIGVFVQSKIAVNQSPFFDYIDNSVDLTEVKWSYFGHQNWILPSPGDFSPKKQNE